MNEAETGAVVRPDTEATVFQWRVEELVRGGWSRQCAEVIAELSREDHNLWRVANKALVCAESDEFRALYLCGVIDTLGV